MQILKIILISSEVMPYRFFFSIYLYLSFRELCIISIWNIMFYKLFYKYNLHNM